MFSSSSSFSPEHHLLPPTSDQLCYVHCNFCDTVLAVSFSLSLFSLFFIYTVKALKRTGPLETSLRDWTA